MSNPFDFLSQMGMGGGGRSKEEMQHVADMFRKAHSVTEYRLVADALDWACGKNPDKFMQLMDILRNIQRSTS